MVDAYADIVVQQRGGSVVDANNSALLSYQECMIVDTVSVGVTALSGQKLVVVLVRLAELL